VRVTEGVRAPYPTKVTPDLKVLAWRVIMKTCDPQPELLHQIVTAMALTFAAGALLPSSAIARTNSVQEQSETTASETIIVTGSRAPLRSVTASPVPVDVFSADNIQSSGAVAGELGQALASIAPSFGFPRQSNSGSSDHVRAGQLRGLNPDQLLVLVNGKRRHSSAIVNSETKIGRGTAAVDFNTIPLGAVKRIEVLRDGAGALYGSDAIAGVINVILQDAPTSLSVSLTHGLHVTDVEPISKSLQDGQTTHLETSFGFEAFGGFFLAGVDARVREATNRAGFDLVPFFVPQTAANLATAGRRNYAEGDPKSQDVNLWYNSESKFLGLDVYGFGTLGSRQTEGATFFRYPDGNDNVRAIYPNGFRPISTGDNLDISTTGGLRHKVWGWNVDASLTNGLNRFEYGVKNSLNASLGSASPRSFNSGRFEFTQLTGNLDARRQVSLADSNRLIDVALGGEIRSERFKSRRGDESSFAAGPFDSAIGAQGAPGLTQADEAKLTRDVFSLYGSVSAELTTQWFTDAALRYEEYSDFGSAATGKLASRFEVNDAISFRASLSNSIRAPGLQQIGFSDTTINFGQNRTLVATRTLPVTNAVARALGAKPLEPETSINYSIGAVWIPSRQTSITFDAFEIEIADRITLSDRFFGDQIAAFIGSQPGGASIGSVRFFTNAVDTQTRGADIVVRHNRPLFGGNLNLELAATWAETQIKGFTPTPAALRAFDSSFALVGVEEVNTIESAAPKSKVIATTTWKDEKWRLLARLSHFGEATRVFNFGGGFEPSQTYGAEAQLDVEAEVQVSRGVSVAFGASNLTDAYPDLSNDLINFFGNLPYDILSPIGINGRYVYGTVKFKF
jgi:iron complex outermembrane receptor protein